MATATNKKDISTVKRGLFELDNDDSEPVYEAYFKVDKPSVPHFDERVTNLIVDYYNKMAKGKDFEWDFFKWDDGTLLWYDGQDKEGTPIKLRPVPIKFNGNTILTYKVGVGSWSWARIPEDAVIKEAKSIKKRKLLAMNLAKPKKTKKKAGRKR